MLAVERLAARALLSDPRPAVRGRAEGFVASSLRAMPTHLRAGVVAESVLVTVLLRARCAVARTAPDHEIGRLLDWLAASPVGLLRQYPRLLRSLVVFAECEAADELDAA